MKKAPPPLRNVTKLPVKRRNKVRNGYYSPEAGENVEILKQITKNDMDDRSTLACALDAAKDGDLKNVIVLGWEPDGSFYFAATQSDGPENAWLLQRALFELMAIGSDKLIGRGKVK